MAKPIKLPQWDTNLTNSAEPVSGRKTDGWATNDVPTSANLNFLFAYIYLWLKWVDDGVWTAASLALSGSFSAKLLSIVGVDGDDHGNPAASVVATFAGGNGLGSTPNGGTAGQFTGGNADDGGTAGGGLIAAGGHAGGNGGDLGAAALTATGGQNQDATYAPALKAPHGGILLQDGGVSATKDVATTANLTATGTGSSIAPPARITGTILTNLWANIGGSAEVFGYWKTAFGEVAIDGLLDASAATSHNIGTMPVGFRPLKDYYKDILDTATNTMQRLTISASSGVINYTGTIGSANNITLAGIRYRTT